MNEATGLQEMQGLARQQEQANARMAALEAKLDTVLERLAE